ncbi:glycosyltransferase family 8 protein [Shimia aestuarii]|uniref:glycosyltransferase family 8 protein n=1 Tax=Shimia aestuarii TaxID=254406 RepID=UPI001FB26DE6
MDNPSSTMRKALVYTVDERERAIALFSAWKVATVAKPRDFDILICSFEPLAIPAHLSALGIRNVVFDLHDKISAENLPQIWLPLITYLRLWLPDALRLRYDRLLYLDADTYLVSPDLSHLFEVDLGPHALAAALDKMQWENPNRPILDFAAQGMNVRRYLNAGVCLFDVEGYNALNLLGQMLEIHRAGAKLQHHDQSLINLATKGHWAELSPRWNWQWTSRFPGLTERADPLLHHFGGAPKPWDAARRPTNFSGPIVEEYATFLSLEDSIHRFETNHYGGLRPSIPAQIKGLVDSALAYRHFRKLLKRHTDAFETRL